MSDKIGLPTYEMQGNQFLPGAPMSVKQVSENTRQLIDSEVKSILEEAEAKAQKFIDSNKGSVMKHIHIKI